MVLDIFRAQRSATKVNFDTDPSQWDVGPTPTPQKAVQQHPKQTKKLGRPRKNMFTFDDADSEKPTPKPTPRRGRPRKLTVEPSPSEQRSSTRMITKRKREVSPLPLVSKRAKVATPQPKPTDARRQHVSRARQASPIIEETEAESEEEFDIAPSADQEEELPFGEMADEQDSVSEEFQNLGESQDEDGDEGDAEEEDVDELMTQDVRRLKKFDTPGVRTRNQARKVAISPVPEESSEHSPGPQTSPDQMYRTEDDEPDLVEVQVEVPQREITLIEESETDDEELTGKVPHMATAPTIQISKQSHRFRGENGVHRGIKKKIVVSTDSEYDEEEENQEDNTRASENEDGSRQRSATATVQRATSRRASPRASREDDREPSSEIPTQPLDENSPRNAQLPDASTLVNKAGSSDDSGIIDGHEADDPEDNGPETDDDRANLDAEDDTSSIFVNEGEEERNASPHEHYLDLEYEMRDIIAPPGLYSDAVQVINELLIAGRAYQATLEDAGYLVDAFPVKKKLDMASPQLKAFYYHAVGFIDQLNDDADTMEVDGEELYLGWSALQASLSKLKDMIGRSFASKSVARLFAYGLFSMVPLIAAATRFHYKLELQGLPDRKRALIMLVSICQAYDQLQLKLREIKSKNVNASAVPIYQAAFGFRKSFIILANWAKGRLRSIVKEEETLKLQKLQEEAVRAAAEHERRRAAFRASGFDDKKDRLIILWNARQRRESSSVKWRMLGSAGISVYLKSVKPSGVVKPQTAFDISKDTWSGAEQACLANALKKHYSESF